MWQITRGGDTVDSVTNGLRAQFDATASVGMVTIITLSAQFLVNRNKLLYDVIPSLLLEFRLLIIRFA